MAEIVPKEIVSGNNRAATCQSAPAGGSVPFSLSGVAASLEKSEKRKLDAFAQSLRGSAP